MEKTITGKDLRNVLQVLSIWGRTDLNGKDLVLSDGDIEKGTDEYTLLQNINELYKLIENIEKGEFDTSGIFSEFDKVNTELVRLSENDTDINNKINTIETELLNGIEKNNLDIETINSDIIEIIEMINNNKCEKGDKGDTGKSAYEIAIDNGFIGSEIQWVESLKGKNGEKGATGDKGLQGIKGDKGEKGATGDKGETGRSAYDAWKELYPYSDLSEIQWLYSLKGENGINGKSAYQIYLDLYPDSDYFDEEHWINNYLKGKDGKDGKDGETGNIGETGKSNYEIAVENGYDGTVAEWLDSIKGVKGDKGNKGEDGKSAYQVALDDGFIGTETAWLKSIKGEKGRDGLDGKNADKGEDGKSAYQVALSTGQTTAGTPEDWIESLKGQDGKSAYKVAIENGYIGTEEQWLESLKGKDGKDAENFTDTYEYTYLKIDTAKIPKIQSDIVLIKDSIENIPNLIATVQANVDDLSTKVTTINNNVASISTRQDTVDRDMVQLKNSYSKLLKTIDVTTIENLKTQVDSNKNDIKNINTDVASVKTDISKLKTDVAKNKTDIATINSELIKVKSDVSSVKTDMTTVKSDISTLKTSKVDVTVFNSKISELETSLSSINSSISQLETKKVDKSVYDAKILEIETILSGFSESITTKELIVDTIKKSGILNIASPANFKYAVVFDGNINFKQQVSFPAGISVTGTLSNAHDGNKANFYDVLVRHNLDVTGQKNAIHPTRAGVLRTGAYETTKTYIGDLRETELVTGDNKIYFNDLFTDIVDLDESYHVFVSAYSDAKVYVKDREKTYFTIISDKETKASYEIKAVRKGFKDLDYELTEHKFIDMEWLFPKQDTNKQ